MADESRKKQHRRRSDPKRQPGPEHVADEPVAEADSLGATVQSPTTEGGLSVEEQVRKEWDPKKDGGLPIPLDKGPS